MMKDAIKKCGAEIMQTLVSDPSLTDCINTLRGVGFALEVLAECLDDRDTEDPIPHYTGKYEDGVSPDNPSDPDFTKDQDSRQHNRGFWG